MYSTWFRPKKCVLIYMNRKLKVEGTIPFPWPWRSKYAIYIDQVPFEMLSIPYMKKINYQPSKYAIFFFQMFIFKTTSKLIILQIRWAEAKLLKFKSIKHKYLLTRYESAVGLLIFHWKFIYSHSIHFFLNNVMAMYFHNIFSYNEGCKPLHLMIEFFNFPES